MTTLFFIAISFIFNWLIYKLIDSVAVSPKAKAMTSAVIVNLTPLGFAAFSQVNVRVLILVYIIETFFLLALSVYDVVIAKASKIIKAYSLKQILFTSLPGAVFYLIFFAVYAFNSQNIENATIVDILKYKETDYLIEYAKKRGVDV